MLTGMLLISAAVVGHSMLLASAAVKQASKQASEQSKRASKASRSGRAGKAGRAGRASRASRERGTSRAGRATIASKEVDHQAEQASEATSRRRPRPKYTAELSQPVQGMISESPSPSSTKEAVTQGVGPCSLTDNCAQLHREKQGEEGRSWENRLSSSLLCDSHGTTPVPHQALPLVSATDDTSVCACVCVCRVSCRPIAGTNRNVHIFQVQEKCNSVHAACEEGEARHKPTLPRDFEKSTARPWCTLLILQQQAAV